MNIDPEVGQPLILYFGATSGSGNATLAIGKVKVATTLDPKTLDGTTQNLSGQAQVLAHTTGFDTSDGFLYYGLNGTGTTTFLSAGIDDAAPVLARYEMSNGVMTLRGFTTANALGLATLTQQTGTQVLEAVVAYQTGLFDTFDRPTLTAKGPTPVPVGVGMVPDLESSTPQTILKLDGIKLAAPYQQKLYQTTIATNITAVPQITFSGSADSGAFSGTISVYDGSNLSNRLARFSFSGTAAQTYTLPGSIGAYAGKSIALLVLPNADSGGSTYSLEMTAATPDETQFLFPNHNVPPNYYLPGVSAGGIVSSPQQHDHRHHSGSNRRGNGGGTIHKLDAKYNRFISGLSLLDHQPGSVHRFNARCRCQRQHGDRRLSGPFQFIRCAG